MSTKIFVNLPVKNLDKSIEFFTKLGYSFNSQFTDETAACMVISDDIYAMLLTYEKFKGFTPKEIADATKSTEVLVALSLENRGQVDEIVRKAVAAGGSYPAGQSCVESQVPGENRGGATALRKVDQGGTQRLPELARLGPAGGGGP